MGKTSEGESSEEDVMLSVTEEGELVDKSENEE